MSKAAYGAYTYAINVTPVGKMGVATFENDTISVPANIVGLDNCTDPRVFYFKDNGNKDRILLFETKYKNYVATNGQISVYSDSLTQLVAPFTPGEELDNLHAVTGTVKIGNDSYMYGIDYDLHKVVRFQVGTDGKILVGKTWKDFKPKTGSLGYGVDVVTDGKYVYALFVSATKLAQGEYDFYSIVRLDLDLTNPVELKVDGEKNPFSLSLYKGDLYVTVLGGMQKYGSTNGAASKIQKVATEGFSATSAVKTLLVGGDSAELGDFRALVFNESDEAYILCGCLNSDAASFAGALYRADAANVTGAAGAKVNAIGAVKYDLSAKGYLWGIYYSEAEEVLWAAQGNDIGVYKYDKNVLKQKAKAVIATLAGSKYSLNTMALLESGGQLTGYVAPEFASVSEAALRAREELLREKK